MILAGDIGGTKTVLALFERDGAALSPLRESTYASEDFGAFDEVLARFRGERADARELEGACFAVAGRVSGERRVEATNLPWVLDAGELEGSLGVARVRIVNDVQATAFGTRFLEPGDFATLQEGESRAEGTVAVLAPGTGLGEATLVFEGKRCLALPSEGGHASFAPRDALECELLAHLQQELGPHVSWERVLSGDGIGAIHRFLRQREGAGEPDWLVSARAEGDANAAITKAAEARTDVLARRALELFASLLGAEAGNCALRSVAEGGVVLAGGIPPRIAGFLRESAFLASFRAKGRFSDWLAGLRVRVALEPRAPLIGAARLFDA